MSTCPDKLCCLGYRHKYTRDPGLLRIWGNLPGKAVLDIGNGAVGKFEKSLFGTSGAINDKRLIIKAEGLAPLHHPLADGRKKMPYLRPTLRNRLSQSIRMLGAHQIAITIIIDLYQLWSPQ